MSPAREPRPPRAPGWRRAALLGAMLLAALAAFPDNIVFHADSVESVLAKGRERTVLSGRAHVETWAITISADRIELFGKDFQYLQCSGSVLVSDSDQGIKLSSPSLYYDRQRKLSRAQGPSILEDMKNKLVLKAEFIENDGTNEVMVAQVAVRILKEDLACRAEYAIYRRKDKQLELTGAPSANKNGDEYHASRIVVNTDTEDISLEGEVGGTVVKRSKDAADSTSAPSGAQKPTGPDTGSTQPPPGPPAAEGQP